MARKLSQAIYTLKLVVLLLVNFLGTSQSLPTDETYTSPPPSSPPISQICVQQPDSCTMNYSGPAQVYSPPESDWPIPPPASGDYNPLSPDPMIPYSTWMYRPHHPMVYSSASSINQSWSRVMIPCVTLLVSLYLSINYYR
ncbi:hypothetical protein ACFX13_015237 [Malus domestica]